MQTQEHAQTAIDFLEAADREFAVRGCPARLGEAVGGRPSRRYDGGPAEGLAL